MHSSESIEPAPLGAPGFVLLLSLSEELRERLQTQAEREGRTPAALTRGALDSYLQRAGGMR